MLFVDGASYKLILPVVEKYSAFISKKLLVGLDVDALLLKECFILAEQSCGFHGEGEASHIKQSAHVGFWINKLRPISTRQRTLDFLKRSKFAVATVQAFDHKYSSRLNEAALFYINEYVALMTIIDLITLGFKDIQEHLPKADDRKKLDKKLSGITENINESAYLMMTSFRHHVHSARATATLFETAYFTGYEN